MTDKETYRDIPVYDSEPYNGRIIGWQRVLSDGTIFDSKPYRSQLKIYSVSEEN